MEISIERRMVYHQAIGQWEALDAVKRKLQYKIWYNTKKQKVCKDPYKFLALYTERKVLIKCIRMVKRMLEQ
jgi:hypothetical protein